MRSPPAGLLGLSLLGRARPPRPAPPVPSSQGCSSPRAPLRSQTRGPAVWSPCCSPRPNASFPVGNSIPSQTVGSIREGFGVHLVHTMLCSTPENRQGLANTGTDGPKPLPRVPVTVKPVGGTVSLPEWSLQVWDAVEATPGGRIWLTSDLCGARQCLVWTGYGPGQSRHLTMANDRLGSPWTLPHGRLGPSQPFCDALGPPARAPLSKCLQFRVCAFLLPPTSPHGFPEGGFFLSSPKFSHSGNKSRCLFKAEQILNFCSGNSVFLMKSYLEP